MNILNVYTDGSYFFDLKSEGLSFRILGLPEGPLNYSAGRVVKKKKGGSSATAEIQAVIQAIKKIKRMSIKCDLIVLNIDFDSIVNAINDLSMYPYENSIFYKKGGDWKELIDLIVSSKQYNIVAKWVKGHKNNINNNIVDLMARNAALNAFEDEHKYFQIYSINESSIHNVFLELKKSHIRSELLKKKQKQELIKKETEQYLSRKDSLKVINKRKRKKYILKEGTKVITIKERMDVNDSINFKAEVLESLYEKISFKINKEHLKKFEFFYKSIENYVENMSFIYEEDKDIYIHIANALKCTRNRNQSINFVAN